VAGIPNETDLDRSVVIVASDGSHLPSGVGLTGPVTSVDKLESLIVWARAKRELLQGAAARVWVVGAAVRQLLGEGAAGDDPTDEDLGRALALLVNRGWELAGGDGRFTLSRDTGANEVNVELVAEAQPWLASGDGAVCEDAGELGRRLQRWVATTGVLPERTAARSAAAVFDAIQAAKSTRRPTPIAAGALPTGVELSTAIQPTWVIANSVVDLACAKAEELVLLEQKYPTLASAGMITVGCGEPSRFNGQKAAAAARADKRPFGVWLATLPAADTLNLPASLPLPHPRMRQDQPVQVWLSSEDLTGLGAAVRDGGAGLAVADLQIASAIVWPTQGRLLETWSTRFREGLIDPERATSALATAAHDYLAALGDPTGWTGRLEHHYQPAWAAAIAAHVRFRGRRAAMRISREHKLWPIYARDGAFIYAVGLDENTSTVIDLADTHTRLGRMTVADRVDLTHDLIIELLSTGTDDQLAVALNAALSIPAAIGVPVEAEQSAAAPVGLPPIGVSGEVPAEETTPGDGDGPDYSAEEQPVVKPDGAGRGRRPAKPAVKLGGVVAAVLHTDGLWLPDGTCMELSEPIVHVGQVAELAWQHNIGYRLSEKFSEPGQIWVTEDVCRAVGVDVESISRRDPDKSLRELTAELDFVTHAADAGWGFGGAKSEKPQLGTWTRIFRTDSENLKGPLVVLIPGMTRKQGSDNPILVDADPARIARRLQMFADGLGYPLKISSGVTAIDLMLQLRPKTHSPLEWRDTVFAPSRTKEPYGITDIESDFEWSRNPTDNEAAMTYIHAYDRGGSYPATLAGLDLPIGDPIHHPDGVQFDPKLPGYWQIEVPESQDWLLPYVLNPRGRKFSGPKWVCTPRLERAVALGYQPAIIEAYVWPDHGRVLRGWYERFRDLALKLDTADPDDRAVRDQAKIVRVSGIGVMGSLQHMEGKTGYSPERRYHIVSKASANIIMRIQQIGVDTGRWPLACITDTVLYASDDPNPVTAWPGDAKSFGRGFGQYKPEGSALLAEHMEFLTGHNYRGKQALIAPDQWAAEMLSETETSREQD